MEFVVKTDIEIHCYNASMYCSHPKKCGKITAARKHGCKYWENGVNKHY